MSAAAAELIQESLELASLPAVVMRAIELLNNDRTSSSEIGDIIGKDPALSARLLKIVNSAYYGFPTRIDTISRAITIVGTQELTDLILGASAINTFARIPNRLIDMAQFWEHSLYTGVICRILARQLHSTAAERCFIIGLLHDIGSLLLYRYRPDAASRCLAMALDSNTPLTDAEQSVLGFDHAGLGADLMYAWQLPAPFIEATRFHHTPLSALHYRLETAIVHLADTITSDARNTASGTHQAVELEPGTWELTGLSADITDSVIAEADIQFEAARAVLLPRSQAA